MIIRIKRGPGSSISTLTLKDGEIVYAKDKKMLYIYNEDTSSSELVSNTIIDVLSNRPNPEIPRRYFWATDTNQLFIDTGSEWKLINTASSDDYKEIYIPVSQADYWYYHLVNKGDYIVWKCRANRTVYLSGKFPFDLKYLENINLYFIGDKNKTFNISFNSDYAKEGESYNSHSQSIIRSVTSYVNKVFVVDVHELFPHVDNNMVFGMSFRAREQCYLIGYSIVYK